VLVEAIIASGVWKGALLAGAAAQCLWLAAGGLRAALARTGADKEHNPAHSFSLTSSAFHPGGRIPAQFTCDGKDVSPPFTWRRQPAATKTLALIVDDPDAPGGVFTHWVLFNLPAGVHAVPRGVPVGPRLSSGALQGQNSFGRVGYSGPCPPPGPAHHYRFTLYALGSKLRVAAGSTVGRVRTAMRGHVRAETRLIGIYARG
jgi:Raf kinase inhibitor-like YbhB/YbcL family protein